MSTPNANAAAAASQIREAGTVSCGRARTAGRTGGFRRGHGRRIVAHRGGGGTRGSLGDRACRARWWARPRRRRLLAPAHHGGHHHAHLPHLRIAGAGLLALVSLVIGATGALAAPPVHEHSGRYVDRFADDFILDLCGIETMTTVTGAGR
ncbi:MAG: hypothetical protein WKF78_00500 [Candidatus Limnocylindrales bacterium]